MKNFLLIASVATMAASMPALAKPDNDKNDKGGNPTAHAGKPQKANGNSFTRVETARKQQGKAQQREAKAEMKAIDRSLKAEARQADQDRPIRYDDDGRGARLANQPGSFCPPGLAKKNNGCLPPGQAKKIFARGERINSDWYRDYNIPRNYRNIYYDTAQDYYRYDDSGYIYRVNRQSNLVSGLIPLLGGGFGVGQMLPAGYNVYNVPIQYRSAYYDTPDAYYRYGDNAIYQVNPQSSMIENVVALLTGNNLGVGQRLPSGYDAYNLPMQYRDQYADNANYDYRYADGNIYQVDTKTRIIQAIISALL